MTEETKAWRETLNTLETELVYYEASLRKKGKTRADTTYLRARLAAVTCARDAVKRKVEKMLTPEAVAD